MTVVKLLLTFWALYFSLIFLTNLLDALKRLNFLPHSWKFDSGNYEYFLKITSSFRISHILLKILFLLMMVMELLSAILFWIAVFNFENSITDIVYTSFISGLILFGGFVLMDEIFISYVPEATHYRIFIALIVTLIFIEAAVR